jgi:hypothetical protein
VIWRALRQRGIKPSPGLKDSQAMKTMAAAIRMAISGSGIAAMMNSILIYELHRLRGEAIKNHTHHNFAIQ